MCSPKWKDKTHQNAGARRNRPFPAPGTSGNYAQRSPGGSQAGQRQRGAGTRAPRPRRGRSVRPARCVTRGVEDTLLPLKVGVGGPGSYCPCNAAGCGGRGRPWQRPASEDTSWHWRPLRRGKSGHRGQSENRAFPCRFRLAAEDTTGPRPPRRGGACAHALMAGLPTPVTAPESRGPTGNVALSQSAGSPEAVGRGPVSPSRSCLEMARGREHPPGVSWTGSPKDQAAGGPSAFPS